MLTLKFCYQPNNNQKVQLVPLMKLVSKFFFTTVNAFNAHTILGLQRMASEKQIKRAYYALAKQYHPDSNPGKDTSQQFQRVTQAYEVMIKEAVLRAQRTTHHTEQKQERPHSKRAQSEGENQDSMFRAYQAFKRKNNIRADNFHKFKEFFQDYTERKKHAQSHPRSHYQKEQNHSWQQQFQEDQQQQDQSTEDYFYQSQSKRNKHQNKKLELVAEVQLSVEQARAGTQKRLRVWKRAICATCQGHPPRREVKCKKCNGSGVHISKNQIGFCWTCGGNRTISRCDCSGCGGKGVVSRHAEEVVHIKAGVANNQEIVVKGKGHQHHQKGYFGDMLIKIRIQGSSSEGYEDGLKKVGFNTYETVRISVIEAVLGTKLKYKTVWGERVLAMKGGVQDGEVIKRSGEGCRKKSNKDNGHHFVTISVTIPINISEEEMGIYERIRDIIRNKKKGY